jgi:hyperosmotically inducible protein
MRIPRQLMAGVFALLLLTGVIGCAAMTGKTAGRTIDDASITTRVKSELAAEKLSTLTRIDVDTNEGTVYLNGTVEDASAKKRASEAARRVSGVDKVVNNLKVQSEGTASRKY